MRHGPAEDTNLDPAASTSCQQVANVILNAESKLAVTGASGWIGAVLTRMALRAGLTQENGRLRVLASTSRAIDLGDGQTVVTEPLDNAVPLEGQGWIAAHLAYLGNEWTRELSPHQFADKTDQITRAFKSFADGAIEPKIIFSSSGAVYGADGEEVEHLERGPYGFMKLKHEGELQAWTEAKGGRFVAPRIYNIGGPLANKQSAYALTSMINSALAGDPIRIKARGPVFRSYIHVEELCALCLSLSANPDMDTPAIFDAAGSEIVELSELAQHILQLSGQPFTGIERSFDTTSPPNWYVGNPKFYRLALSRMGITSTPLTSIVEDTIDFLKRAKAKS